MEKGCKFMTIISLDHALKLQRRFNMQTTEITNYFTYDTLYTLNKFSNWTPYIFTLVLKVRFGFAKLMLLYINHGFAKTHLKMTGTSCIDDARAKVSSFQKVTFFLNIPQTDAIHV